LKKNAPTGVCLFLQNRHKPSYIASSPSASLLLEPNDIAKDLIVEASIAVLDGFLLDRTAIIKHVMDTAGEYGTIVALDVASVEMVKAHAQEILGYCRDYPLILFMNKDEAEAFYKSLNNDGEGAISDTTAVNTGFVGKLKNLTNSLPQDVCTFLQKLTNDLFPIIAVKLEAKGVVVFAGGKAHHADTLSITPKEATGAGDAFCAGFLSAWLRNKPISECAGFGNKTAREVLDVNGTLVDKKKLASIAKLL
jgi:sugar/nucleoside kinase (ribokinase family)